MARAKRYYVPAYVRHINDSICPIVFFASIGWTAAETVKQSNIFDSHALKKQRLVLTF